MPERRAREFVDELTRDPQLVARIRSGLRAAGRARVPPVIHDVAEFRLTAR